MFRFLTLIVFLLPCFGLAGQTQDSDDDLEFILSESVNSICVITGGSVAVLGGAQEDCINDNEFTVDALRQIDIDLAEKSYQLRVVDWNYEFTSNSTKPLRILEYIVTTEHPGKFHKSEALPNIPSQATSYIVSLSKAPVRCYFYSEDGVFHNLCYYGLQKHQAMKTILKSRQKPVSLKRKKCD